MGCFLYVSLCAAPAESPSAPPSFPPFSVKIRQTAFSRLTIIGVCGILNLSYILILYVIERRHGHGQAAGGPAAEQFPLWTNAVLPGNGYGRAGPHACLPPRRALTARPTVHISCPGARRPRFFCAAFRKRGEPSPGRYHFHLTGGTVMQALFEALLRVNFRRGRCRRTARGHTISTVL